MKEIVESEYQLTDTGYYILLALLEPRHGYGIMKFIEGLSNSEFIVGPATLYTTLKKMQKSNYIIPIGESEDRKKIYQLTALGTKVINDEINRRIRMANQGLKVLKNIKKENYNEE